MRHLSRRFPTRRQEVAYLLWLAFLLVFVLPILILVVLLYQVARSGSPEVIGYIFGATTLGLVGFALLRSELLAMFPSHTDLDGWQPREGGAEEEESGSVLRLEGLANRFDDLLEHFHDNANELTHQILHLSTINEISEFSSRVTNLNELLDRVLIRSMKVVNAEIGSIMRLVDGGTTLELIAAYGLEVDSKAGIRVPLEDSLARVAIREGKPVVVPDLARDSRFDRDNDPKYGPPSFLSIPLHARGELIGVLNLSKKVAGTPFSDEDVQFLNAAFSQIAFALENARLYEEVEDGYQKLKRLNQRLKEYASGLETEVAARTGELEEANARLQSEMERVVEADRVKSDFIASTSHELRTPLNAILGFSSLILSGQEGEITDQVRSDLEIIHQAGESLLRIVSTILDTSSIETGHFRVTRRPVPLLQILQELEAEAKKLPWGAEVSFIVDLPDTLYLVSADKGKLLNALLQILDNAVKFTPEGEVRLTAWQRGDNAVVEISDTGIGIEERDLPFIFDKFWQRPSQRGMGGTGLGLALAQRIIDAHDGRIDVKSERGAGATFTVTLPTI